MSKLYNKTVSNFKQVRKNSFKDEDSVSYIKSKYTFEKLKENLYSPVMTATSREGFPLRETQCETEKNATLKSTLRKMVELKKHRIQMSKELVNQKQGLSQKEKMRLELENEFLHHKHENENLKADIEISEKVLLVSKENCESVSKYREKLKDRYKDFVETIDKYEERIKSGRKEKDEMVKKYEANLQNIHKESEKIKDENKTLKKKIEKQQLIVKEQVMKYQDIDDDMIRERKDFEAKEEENKTLYDEFMGKMKNLEKKIHEYKYLTVYKEQEDEMATKKENKDKDDFEKLKMKLLDIEHQNQFLLSKVAEAERQINELEASQVPLTLKEKLEMFKLKKQQAKKGSK